MLSEYQALKVLQEYGLDHQYFNADLYADRNDVQTEIILALVDIVHNLREQQSTEASAW